MLNEYRVSVSKEEKFLERMVVMLTHNVDALNTNTLYITKCLNGTLCGMHTFPQQKFLLKIILIFLSVLGRCHLHFC